MKKSCVQISLRLVLTLLFGIVLGMSLSSMVFYPKKFSTIFQNVKINNTNIEKLNTHKSLELINIFDESLADKLSKDIRVLCWVLTMPENHKTKAVHVKNTWGKRCNKLLFMSTIADPQIDSIALPVEDGRSPLWDKTKCALQYIYNYHYNDADYFLKADDDSYFIMENVRYMLSQYHPKTSLIFGHRYASSYVSSGSYMAGGGYILSKKSLEKFVLKIMNDKDKCNVDNYGAEDLELGKCLENQTIFVDERDELQQKRFFPVGIIEHFGIQNPNSSYWYDQNLYYDSKYGGIDCCSDTIVNLHYITPKEMYAMDYLIYNVHPFGIDKNSTETIPNKIPLKEILRASDVKSNATSFSPKFEAYHEIRDDEKFR